jgi:hypothetical protein
VKPLVAPEGDSGRDFVLGMVRTSLRLHRSGRVLLFAHNDCGAYPGVPAETIAADAAKAAAFLRAAEPAVQVETFFCDFDGIYSV